MTDSERIEQLERRVRELEATRAVEQAMHDYWYALDFKDWEALDDCFTEDVEADYGRPDWRHTSRASLVAWLRQNEGGDNYSVSHAGHNPRVEIVDDDTAKALFKLHDWVRIEPSITLRGWGHYRMQFQRGADRRWRIHRLRLDYVYKEEMLRYVGNDPPQMTQAMK